MPITIGILLLIAQVFRWEWLSRLVMLLLGAAFIVWRIAVRILGLLGVGILPMP